MQFWTSLIRQTLLHILSYFYLKAVSSNHFKRNGSEVTGASGRISLNALSTPLVVHVVPQKIEKYEPARISFSTSFSMASLSSGLLKWKLEHSISFYYFSNSARTEACHPSTGGSAPVTDNFVCFFRNSLNDFDYKIIWNFNMDSSVSASN